MNSTAKSLLSVFLVLLMSAALLGKAGVKLEGPPTTFAQSDTTAPTVSSVAITSDSDENDADLGAYSVGRNSQSTNWAAGVYRIGDDVQVTVTFSEDVAVTGSPRLELAIGSRNRNAEYESTDGSAVVFSYTVAEGDRDSDGIAIGANKLTLNGGSIKDTSDNDANLSHNAIAAQDGHKVDGIRPKISRLFLAPSTGGSDGAYSEGEEMIIVADFTEDHPRGSVTGPPQIKLDFDGQEKMAPWDISLLFNSPRDYGIFGYVVKKGDLDSNGVAISANSIDLNGGFIRDSAGNDAVLTHSAVAASSTFKVDAVAPTVSSIAFTSDPGDDDTYGTGDRVEVTVTFSEDMSIPRSITCSPSVVHCKTELELDIGGVAKTADYVSHSGADVVFAYTVQTGDTDENGIAIGANKLTGQLIRDAAGQNGLGINEADLSHDAVADNSGHKVATTVQPAKSTDAALSALTLSEVDFGTFASATTFYTVEVTNSPTDTTVTPTVNHSGASYVIKLGGVADSDGTVSLAAGENVITVEVTAEDGQTTKTYTVTITRLVTSESNQVSSDATLSALTLSGIDFGAFASGAESYTATVPNGVTETTVTPTVNHSEASYVVKLGGVTDTDGTVSLVAGSNIITVEVTAEDGETTKTYTVTVERAATPSTDATLEWLTLSGIDIGDGLGDRTYVHTQTSFAASVYHSVAQTTVTASPTHSEASYVVKLGGVTDADSTVSLAAGSNVITVEVTAEDGQTTRVYTTTVTRATASAPTTGELATDDPRVNFRTISYSHSFVALTLRFPRNRGITGLVTQRYKHDGSSFVSAGEYGRQESIFEDDLGGSSVTWTFYGETEPDTLYKWVAKLLNNQSATVIETSLTVRTPPEPGTTELSSDATLSNLTLSGIDFEASDRTFVGSGFYATVTSYAAAVANSVTETTVTPTVNHSGASYVIKLDGTTDADGTIALALGSNVVTIEVTAEDGNTARTYTVTVTRAAPPSTDATLSGLTLSNVNFGTFSSGTTTYNASVANGVSQTTVTPTVNHSGATYVIRLAGVTDADGTVALAVGSNVITIEVTAEDESTTKTYTITVTRSSSSIDATLSGLTLSGIDFGTFASGTLSYTAEVTNDPTETTVTPTVSHSGASYVIKIGGVADSDGTVSLEAGENIITIEVTAEDGQTTKTYTITVTRLITSESNQASSDARLGALTLSNSDISIGTFASSTESYTASVAYGVSQTTVRPTVNHSGASYVIKLNGVRDADGTVSLAVGSNVITVVVTAEDGQTTKTYTITVTRATASTDATLSALTLSDINFGTFASGTTSYSATVANSVSRTTVTPTVSHSGASYVIKLGGVRDTDGTVSLAVGSNVITVQVTAEDDKATQTYTVTVTREQPATSEQLSNDASLSALALSGIDFGTFDSTTASYTVSVPNRVLQTTVSVTPNHSAATYAIKLGGVTDDDGVIALSVGSNVITAEVTAEDGESTEIYSVAVTREAPLSTDATLSALTLSGIDFGTFDPATTSYDAEVANDVAETAVAPTANHSGASYTISLDGVEDTDGVLSLAVGENVITVEITAEDGETTLTYTVTVTRAEQLSLLLGELPSDDPPVNFHITAFGENEVDLAWEIPHNRGITGYTLERYDHDGTEFVSSDWRVSDTVAGGGSAAGDRYRTDAGLTLQVRPGPDERHGNRNHRRVTDGAHPCNRGCGTLG